jgi:hypothetical protein
MEKQIAEGKIGNVGDYDLDFKDGKFCAEVKGEKGPLEVGVVVKLDAVDVACASLEWLKGKIPGAMDDILIDAAIAQVQKLKQA